MDVRLPSYVKYAVNTLRGKGFEAYLVGGCVRDILMNRTPSDYDITTDASPEEIFEAFPKEKKITSGMKHGTVAPIISGRPVEITAYRVDGEYKDARRPENVRFTRNLYEDLKRRDFTMNAIAMGITGEIIDPYFGREDIENGIIRAVGDAEKRFSEDALRIMRALRFSSVLGFEIEEKTLEAMQKHKALLKKIAPERIYSELSRLLTGKAAGSVLDKCGVLYSKNTEALKKRSDEEARSLPLSYALFFGDAEKAACGFSYLRADKKTRSDTLFILENELPAKIGLLRLFISRYGEERAESLLRYKLLTGEPSCYEKVLSNWNEAVKSAVFMGELAVGGEELLALGLSGAEIGDTMKLLLYEVNVNGLENSGESIADFLRKHIICKHIR